MSLQVALLRGVNLGKRKVVMSELRALCEGAGFSDVRTLLASGNVVLDAKLKGAKLEAKLEALFLEGLGFKTDVYVRDRAELAKVIGWQSVPGLRESVAKFHGRVLHAREPGRGAGESAKCAGRAGGDRRWAALPLHQVR